MDDELYQRYAPFLRSVLLRLGAFGSLPFLALLLRFVMQRRAERTAAIRRRLEARRDDAEAKTYAYSGPQDG